MLVFFVCLLIVVEMILALIVGVGNHRGVADMIMIGLFWLIVFMTMPFALTFVYLIITLVALQFFPRFRGTGISDNNWVFYSVVTMAAVSGFMAYMNPLIPSSRSIFGIVKNAPKVSMLSSFFWRWINWFFFGKMFTLKWKAVAWRYAGWAILATFVSFTDAWHDSLTAVWEHHKAKKAKAKPGEKISLGDLVNAEIIGGTIAKVLIRIITGIFPFLKGILGD